MDTEKKNSRKKSSRSNPILQMEPSLSEKLAHKRFVADAVEDRLQEVRLDVDHKVQLVREAKKELNRRELKLLESVKNIGQYVQDIYTLKRKGEVMCKELAIKEEDSDKQICGLQSKLQDLTSRKDSVVGLLNMCQPVKDHLEDMVKKMREASRVKDLVGYYLVLKALRKDLILENMKLVYEDEKLKTNLKAHEESTRTHPLTIMMKENVVYKIQDKKRKVRYKNVDLQNQIDTMILANRKEDMNWGVLERWINNTFYLIRNSIQLKEESSYKVGDSLSKLKYIQDFVMMASIMSELSKKLEPQQIKASS